MRCRFDRCQIVYSGATEVLLYGCVFISCEWVFAGPARDTLVFLSALYRGLEQGGGDLVESIFQGVRDGTISTKEHLPAQSLAG